jgi:putative restriction endonuclease
VRAYVAVTDRDWFRFLRGRPDLDEVNFWQPGGTRQFRVLSVGEPFLFKLHYPDHAIVGGGYFRHASLVPTSLAWEAFAEKNGALSLDEMRRRIERYRRVSADPHEDYTVGCIILQDSFFFPESDWIPPPTDFHRNTQQGKSYDLTAGEGRELWATVRARLRLRPSPDPVGGEPGQPVYGDPVLVRPRLGQGTFRVLITDTYRRRCAVTGERTLPVLEAAHIRPVAGGGDHRLDNGLLLRSDVHTLFDRGYLTVSPELRVLVSRRLQTDFHNGEHYRQFAEHTIWVPDNPEIRPRQEFLEWHRDTVFRG